MNAALEKVNDKVFELKYGKAEVFWYENYNSSKGYKEYHLKEPELRLYLKREGFRNFEGDPVKITGNIARKVTSEDIFKHTLKYVESFEEAGLEAMFIKKGETLLLKNKAIVISLPECEVEPLQDTKTKSFKYYKNGIVVVEAEKDFQLIPYEKAKGFIWEDTIKKRNFEILGDEEIEKAVFARFIRNVTNNEDHFNSLCTAIGYLIHTYKDQRKPIAIIINDENLIDEGKPEGGTGKGLIVKAIAQIVEKASYNGKNADFSNNKFAFQNVEDTSAIILIDDAPRNFDFEALFSVLTDDLPIEKKHRAVKVIPYERSPKFVITTNYTIKGDSSSFKRRRFDIFLNNTYSSGHTPADDFGDEFFHSWDEKEWQSFDLFMMACLRSFLALGLTPYEDEGLRLKMLKNETSADFFELMEEDYNIKNILFTYISIREKLLSIYGEKYYFLEKNKKKIVEWVERYANHKGYTIQKSRNGDGSTFLFT
ncbi:hypothetical protein FHG64_16020 [Antarcticibacterium flavum]|uniref:NrS-1 polymerase-like helicase domain-containing protein n=1 Tax=Antarcticibacterium flavum TaxID=2058175 RepID=A0A5B7X6N8_9FLAO|nr:MULTISPECIES: DUF5906 domain-containing protein [Antarcticibacterium]MCM4161870.1 hypothetical protein [Antarcticibacterium sp. W02-3]QCY70775.1 hypothetical protein FHG64_16020 [Antarcticibacterium flavum]